MNEINWGLTMGLLFCAAPIIIFGVALLAEHLYNLYTKNKYIP